jgi:hypothetical protein
MVSDNRRKKLFACLICGSLLLPALEAAADSQKGILSEIFCAEDEKNPENDVVIEETEDAADPEIFDDGTEPVKKSLLETRPEIFSVGTFLSIDTVGDDKKTTIKSFDTIPGILHVYKLAKDDGVGKWDDVKVLRKTKYIYSPRLKFDDKYEGYRDTIIGVALETVLGLKEQYDGTILLDEYKNYPLWNVSLKNIEELRALLDYLYKALDKRGKKSFDLKPVIRLRLEEDILLQSLELEDLANLSMLFDVVEIKDLKTAEFFNNTQSKVDGLLEKLSKDTHSPHEGYRKHLFCKAEDFFEDYEIHEWISHKIGWAGETASSLFVAWLFWQVFDAAKDKVAAHFFSAEVKPTQVVIVEDKTK